MERKEKKINAITWPTSDKVLNQFVITLVGIAVLIVFFLVIDDIISMLLKNFF